MKTEDLQAKGLNQEQIDFVMSEYGKDVNAIKAERDGYKTQLDTAQTSLKAMEGIDAAGLQTKVSDLTKQLQDKDTEIDKIKADYAFDASVKEAIRKASGRNEKAIMALLDVDALKASKNQAQDIEAAITALKKDNDYLFRSNVQVPRVVSSTSGINNDVQTKKEQANEALRSLLGKGE
ncbi:MAG: phage scaffolding protein [Lachnospiraceae bacterium]